MRPALAALVCALLAASAGAQGYPSEPVRIVVPFKQTAKLDILVIQYKGTGASAAGAVRCADPHRPRALRNVIRAAGIRLE